MTNSAAGVVLTLLVPFAVAGLALINTGLCRSRNAAHGILATLLVAGVAALAYFAVGFSVAGAPSAAGQKWIAAQPLFLRGIAPDVEIYVLFGMFAAILAAAIPLGSGADRWRLGASCAAAAITAGWIFPLLAHWTLNGGWLAQIGLVDSGGAGAIHAVGGMTALAIAWILGPRRGKYNRDGMPTAIPGHNAVLVLLGCFLAWIGFLGLNAAATSTLAALNTTLSAAAAALTAAAITRVRFRKPDASLCANGWVAGLVSASAGCGSMRPAAAVLAGAIGGALAIYSIEWLELHLSVDDPGGAISVHGVGGIWSLIAAGLMIAEARPWQWAIQLIGVATILGCVLPMAYGLNLLLNRFYRLRVAPEAERQGLDLYELGAGAYPDFMTHQDDSWMR